MDCKEVSSKSWLNLHLSELKKILNIQSFPATLYPA